jgi:hypothetical protein
VGGGEGRAEKDGLNIGGNHSVENAALSTSGNFRKMLFGAARGQ